jgi:macrolide transport system ATP-binding/permease protein
VESGSLFIDDVDVARLNDFELATLRNQKIGFVFQQFHLLPKTSVINNVLLPTKYPCEIKKNAADSTDKAKRLIEYFGLVDQIDKMPNQLSGGQQQRVAIARSLINDADIILADEPTGNLDSKNAEQVIELLKELNGQGKTVVVITHDTNIAHQFNKVYEIHDGKISKDLAIKAEANRSKPLRRPSKRKFSPLFTLRQLIPLAFENMRRHKVRSWLTMLGISIGVAAVLATTTLGNFTKDKMLTSYAELGVNTINFSGYPNFNLTATDDVPAIFKSFSDERDLKPLKRIFPNIRRIAPQSQMSWSNTITYGGRSVGPNVFANGVGEATFAIMNWPLKKGTSFFPYHMKARSPVCIIGSDVERDLFRNVSPINKIIHISEGEKSYVCRIIGVLTQRTSNKPWDTTPNLKVFLPYTYFMATTSQFWGGSVQNVLIEIEEGSGLEKTGLGIKNFFEKKYGKSGEFGVGFDATLLEQMNKFLNIFALVLTVIALICLGVGGISIANMMLVSLSERFKEIGLRKAVGATNASIRMQFLLESLFICLIAGLFGLVFGFAGYQGAIYGASKLVQNLKFEWIIDKAAVILAFVSIVVVGFLSGLVPALKAERLEIAEALRAE